jgi:hypothetical protein
MDRPLMRLSSACACILRVSYVSAISSLKDTVEGLKTLDQYAELLIRLLCILPGWNEKNIQVWKLVFCTIC